MQAIIACAVAFLRAIGLLVLRGRLVRVEGSSSLPDVAQDRAPPGTEKGKRLAGLMELAPVFYPALVTLVWWLVR